MASEDRHRNLGPLAEACADYPKQHADRVAAVAERALDDATEVETRPTRSGDERITDIIRPDPQRVARKVAIVTPGAEYRAETFRDGPFNGGAYGNEEVYRDLDVGVISIVGGHEIVVFADHVEIHEAEEAGDDDE